MRLTDWPTTRCRSTGLSAVSVASGSRIRRLPSSVSRAMAGVSSLCRHRLPFVTLRSAAEHCRASAASSTRFCRTCAAAIRSGRAVTWMVSLAMVGPWLGVSDVSPSTNSTAAKAKSSSSAMICASAVRMPVPRSTWPQKATMRPSAVTQTYMSKASSGAASFWWSPFRGATTARIPLRLRSSRRDGGDVVSDVTRCPYPCLCQHLAATRALRPI